MQPSLNGNRDPHFFTPKEAASYLRVSVRSIYNWIDKGKIKARDFGSKKHPCYRIPKDKFIAWANGTEN